MAMAFRPQALIPRRPAVLSRPAARCRGSRIGVRVRPRPAGWAGGHRFTDCVSRTSTFITGFPNPGWILIEASRGTAVRRDSPSCLRPARRGEGWSNR